MTTRMAPLDRKQLIMDAAIQLARRQGYQNVKRADIADIAGVSNALVSKYFATMPQLKRAIMRHAVTIEDHVVVMQGLACGDPQARKASQECKARAADMLVK
jgi:AcrR family transcriptional regulator